VNENRPQDGCSGYTQIACVDWKPRIATKKSSIYLAWWAGHECVYTSRRQVSSIDLTSFLPWAASLILLALFLDTSCMNLCSRTAALTTESIWALRRNVYSEKRPDECSADCRYSNTSYYYTPKSLPSHLDNLFLTPFFLASSLEHRHTRFKMPQPPGSQVSPMSPASHLTPVTSAPEERPHSEHTCTLLRR